MTTDTIRCPNGHAIGEGWEYLEDVPHGWRYAGTNDAGDPVCHGDFEWYGDCADPESARWSCGECFETFPATFVPDFT